MHDHPGIWPNLPARELDDSARTMLETLTKGDDEWLTCWEYVLTHTLTESEGSAFWHGAFIAMKAVENTHTWPGVAP